MKPSIVCLVLLSAYGAQGQMYGGEWMADLFQNIERMNTDIQSNVMSMTRNLEQDIRDSVSEITNAVQREAMEAANSSQGMNSGTNLGSVSISSGPGISRSVLSGLTPEGQPYRREVEERVVDNILYHTERIYNPTSGQTNEIRFTLNLTDPNARPVMDQN